MTILVTGGAGFIGSCIVEEIVKNGWEAVVVDDLSTGALKMESSRQLIFISKVV